VVRRRSDSPRRKAKKGQPPFVYFSIDREYLGRDGLWNPRVGTPPLKAAFQVNVFGSRKHYLQLAEFLREFAEQDTSRDGEHHEHFEKVMSADGNARLHFILRKDDVGDSAWAYEFPELVKKQRGRSRRRSA
jgi:hypothetical protein